jgi:hypothetical protein
VHPIFTWGYFLAFSLFGQQGMRNEWLVQKFDQIGNNDQPYMVNLKLFEIV